MSPSEGKYSVLLVDDAKFVRMKLKSILEKDDFEVIGEAEDGKSAIEQFKELKPDLVTMDITMPDMDGITSLKEILKIDAKAKVVMISALGQKQKVLECVTSGAKDFVLKPFEPEKVIAVIKRVVTK